MNHEEKDEDNFTLDHGCIQEGGIVLYFEKSSLYTTKFFENR